MTDTYKPIIESIGRLAVAVQSFHNRFGLVGQASQSELLSRIPIQDEEVRELHDALQNEPPEHVAEEAADVLFVAIGTILRLDPGLVVDALNQVIKKNDSKTTETHHINPDGKVVRNSTEYESGSVHPGQH